MDALDTQRALTRTRLTALRGALAARGLAACIVPSADPHLSEYLPERWQGRQWLSGFSGSVGTLVVTADFAGLWVDSRYWVQAQAQLAGTGIALMKVNVAASTAHIDWLATRMPPGARVAVDGAVLGLAVQRQLRDALAPRGVELVTDIDVLDDIWPDRPGLPRAAVFEHKAQFVAADRRAPWSPCVPWRPQASWPWERFRCRVPDTPSVPDRRSGPCVRRTRPGRRRQRRWPEGRASGRGPRRSMDTGGARSSSMSRARPPATWPAWSVAISAPGAQGSGFTSWWGTARAWRTGSWGSATDGTGSFPAPTRPRRGVRRDAAGCSMEPASTNRRSPSA